MTNTIRRLAALLLCLCLALGLTGCALTEEDAAVLEEMLTQAVDDLQTEAPEEELVLLPEDGNPAPTPEPETAPAPAEPDAQEAQTAPAEKPAAPELSLPEEDNAGAEPALDPDGWYTTKEDVALYLYTYGELPGNFITKNEARDLGWSGGGLDDYADGKSIGGDRFGNYEGILPAGNYHECDINTMHAKSRGAERLVYSDDGRIYYTGDHYESFELLYGEE